MIRKFSALLISDDNGLLGSIDHDWTMHPDSYERIKLQEMVDSITLKELDIVFVHYELEAEPGQPRSTHFFDNSLLEDDIKNFIAMMHPGDEVKITGIYR